MSEHIKTMHQQAGGLPISEFADLEGLTLGQAVKLAKAGKILGATQAHGGRWWVYPPAKVLSRPREYKRRPQVELNGAEQDARRPRTPNRVRVPAPFIADQQTPQGCAAGVPAVYRSEAVQQTCECLREAALRIPERFELELSEPELLQLWLIVERWRGRELEDIRKGRTSADNTVTQGLYGRLSKLVYSRMPSVGKSHVKHLGIQKGAMHWRTRQDAEIQETQLLKPRLSVGGGERSAHTDAGMGGEL